MLDAEGNPVPGIYATGWIKRGPVGLIGHTKGDALETIGFLLEDRLTLPPAQNPDPQAIIDLLEERGIEYTTWEGWNKLDAHEAALGEEWSDRGGRRRRRARTHQGGAARGNDRDLPRLAANSPTPAASGGVRQAPLDLRTERAACRPGDSAVGRRAGGSSMRNLIQPAAPGAETPRSCASGMPWQATSSWTPGRLLFPDAPADCPACAG